MHTRLYSFLTKYKILYEYQFGFRKGHSTSLALISIIDKVSQLLDSKQFVIGVYLDLTKAFDTVKHDILLRKLEHYGIRGLANKWFSSYLSNRKQFVHVNGTKSDTKDITIGVPQGSVLGPLLFLIYVNDMVHAISEKNCAAMLFADDTNLFVRGTDLKQVKRETEQVLRELHIWFLCNKLTLNLEKTKYNIFHTKNKKIQNGLDKITVAGTEINRVNEAKYLGLILDETLSFIGHIDNLVMTLRKFASSFKIIKNYVPDYCKRQLFYAFVNSRVQYGVEVYGMASAKHIKRVQVMQNRILKTLFNKEWLTPTAELHKDLKILQVNDLYKANVMKFVYKCIQGVVPDVFLDHYTCITHNHRTRQANKLNVPRTRIKIGEKNSKVVGAKLYNNLPNDIKDSVTLKSFSKRVNNMLLNGYS